MKGHHDGVINECCRDVLNAVADEIEARVSEANDNDTNAGLEVAAAVVRQRLRQDPSGKPPS